MMHNYFPFGFPYYRPRYPYYNNYAYQRNVHINRDETVEKTPIHKENMQHISQKQTFKKHNTNSNISILPVISNSNNDSSNKSDNRIFFDNCFELFGFKFYFDDLLILFLLFFLYKEDVKDTYLYIALLMLLFS